MIKRLVFAVLAAFTCGAVHADDSGFASPAIDAMKTMEPAAQAEATPAVSDLALDAAFDGNGKLAIVPPAATGWSTVEDGLRVFPWITTSVIPGSPPIIVSGQSGYYIVGKQKSSAGDQWRAWITRVNMGGARDVTFGTDGWIFGGAQDDVVDAVIVGDKAYVLSNIWGDTVTPIVRVACIDLTTPTGNNCFSSVFSGLISFGVSASGTRVRAYGQRLAYDSRYGLFVAARVVNIHGGQELGVARLDAEDGSLVTGFRDDGFYVGPGAAGDVDIQANDMVITPNGTNSTPRVYVAGKQRRDATDSDGFIVAFNPDNGLFKTGWFWNNAHYEEDNSGGGFLNDSITAITVLRNGKLAFAGWSETGEVGLRPMIMGRFNIDGSYDESFCEGNPGKGVRACMVEHNIDEFYWPDSQPVALMEREQNRDLVVALRSKNNGVMPPTNVLTRLEQYGANGNKLHASINLDYTTGSPWSRPFGMWMGRAGTFQFGEERVAVIGTRLSTGTDFDAVVTHLKATDSIFADRFGGAHAD